MSDDAVPGGRGRHRPGGPATSDISAAALAALLSVGLDPVGQVMGACVWCLDVMPRDASTYTTRVESHLPAGSRWPVNRAPLYAQELRRPRALALRRLREQAQALGAHGVVNVALSWSRWDGDERMAEVTATGTAVRARSAIDPAFIFSAASSAEEVAALMIAGWVPCGIAHGIGVAVQQDDGSVRASRLRGNQEVPSLTDLVTWARHWSRSAFEAETRRTGGTGAVLGRQELEVRREETGTGPQRVAIATLVGTALVALPRKTSPAPVPPPLPMLRLPARARAV